MPRRVADGLVLRDARDDDGPALLALIGACYREYEGCLLDPDGYDADLHAWASHLADRNGAGWVVTDADGAVVACIGAAPAATEPPGEVELKRLYVAVTARRRGLGQALTAHAEAWARQRGATRVVAWSDTRFTDAHRLYERLGYVRQTQTRDLHDISNTTEACFRRVLGGTPSADH